MGFQTVIVYHSTSGREPPGTLRTVAHEHELTVSEVSDPNEVMAVVNRTLPRAVVLDSGSAGVIELCRKLKSDAFSAIVPVVMLVRGGKQQVGLDALDAGADEVLFENMPEIEQVLRFRVTLNRADRDVSVHP